MKIKIMLTAFFLLVISANAQNLVGIQGGINFANLSNPGNLAEGAVWTTRMGFVGGAFASIHIGFGLSLQPEIRFVQKGTDAEFDAPSYGHVTSSVTNSYVEIPIYLKYRLFNWKSPLSIIAGSTFSHLVTSRGESNSNVFGSQSADMKIFYKSYDISVDAGVATQYEIGSRIYLTGSLMYSFGLVKIDTMESNEMTRDIRLVCGISYCL